MSYMTQPTGALVLATAMGLGAILSAQPVWAKSEQKLEQRVEHLTEHLALTEEQAGQVRAILTEAHAKKQAAYDAMLEAKRQQMEQAHQRIRAILTAEQVTAFDAWKAEKQDGKKERCQHCERGGEACEHCQKHRTDNDKHKHKHEHSSD